MSNFAQPGPYFVDFAQSSELEELEQL